MKKFVVLSALLAACPALGQVDWPLYRSDGQRTGAQAREHILDAASLGKVQLLWTRRLGAQPLTAPVILGRLISHRGFLELMFIASSVGDVYAVDDDLNRVFWHRKIPRSSGTCGSGLMAAPFFPPLPHNAVDSDEDNPYAPRPVYVLGGDGKLYKLNPMTGEDISPPVSFVPPNAKVSDLDYSNKTIYTTTSGDCGAAAAVWSFNIKTGAIASYRVPAGGSLSAPGVAIGNDGAVYAAGEKEILALHAGDLKLDSRYPLPGALRATGMAVFKWQGRDVLAVYGDGLVLLDGAKFGAVQKDDVNGLAISEGAERPRLYASSPAGITAFAVEDENGHPALKRLWNSSRVPSTAPVIANGIVYSLSTQGGRAVLYALEASRGREVYSSRKPIDAPLGNSGLAAANGHVCFGTQAGSLYCFGLPIDL
jgi:outer membrane protein assembly factor BamB